jgi:hypothetical protein
MTAGDKRSQKTSWKQRGSSHNGTSTTTTTTAAAAATASTRGNHIFGSGNHNSKTNTSSTGRKSSSSSSDDVSPYFRSKILYKDCLSLTSFDKFHNESTPCCNGLRNIVQTIFPDYYTAVVTSCGEGGKSGDNHDVVVSSTSSAMLQPAQSHTLQTQQNTTSKLLSSSNHQSMSLLNLMVRKFLLDDRRRNRQKLSSLTPAGADSYLADQNKGLGQSGDDQDDDDDHSDDALGRFLDSFLYTSDKLKTTTTDGVPLPPPHRTIESFLEYIQKCIDMEKLSKEHGSKTGHSKRTSTRQKGKNTKTIHSSFSSSCMPPIPMTDVLEILDKTTCRNCRGDCNGYLKKIINAKFDNSRGLGDNLVTMTTMGREKGALVVAMGMEDDEMEFGDKQIEETKTKNIQNQGNNVKIITSIQLNECSEEDDRKGIHMSYNGFHWNQNDVEYAFDYNLLEEGGGIAEEDEEDKGSKQQKCEEIEATKKGIWLDLVQEQNSSNKFFQLKHPTTSSSNSVFTVEDFEIWVKEIIIPGGMIETWPFGVSEEDIQLLSKRCNSSLIDYMQILKHEMPQVLFGAHKALADAEESLKTPGVFNVKAGKALKECDQYQNTFMNYCRTLLVDIDRLTAHSRRHRHPYQKWSNQIMDGLWEFYISCSFSLIDPCMRFMWEGIQLDVNRTGSVPMHFNSPQQRENLKEILEKRFFVISQLQDSIEGKLLGCVQGGDKSSTNLRHLVLFGHFFSLYQEGNNVESNKTKAAIDLMLETRDKVLFEVIYYTSVHKILNVQTTRCNNLYHEISRAYTMVCNAMKNIKMCRKDLLTWQTNSIIIEESQIEYEMLQTKNSEPSLEKDIHRVQVLCDFTKNVLQQYRFLQQLEISSVKEVNRIPREVLDIYYSTSPTLGCQGSYGKRRIVGILSSYVYSWLEEKCIEWHAELTHQELMIETENELLQEQINCNVQKKKSKKKKKRKNTKTASPEEANNEFAHAKQRDLGSDLNSNNTDAVCESHTDGGIVADGKDIKNVENTLLQTNTKPSNIERVSTTSSNEAKQISNKNENVQVFVSDQGNLVSIESFLCSRYFRVLKESRKHSNAVK